MAAATGSPCGACKFLRRKCTADCIFAPYFCSEQDPSRFASIHKVFGASNLSKLLLHLPPSHRCDAVAAIAYEAQARITDPVYGCVSHIVALQQQVAYLQAQLMMAKAQLSQRMIDRPPRNAEIHPWFDNSGAVIGSSSLSPSAVPNYTYYSNISINDGIQQEIQSRDESLQNYYSKKI